MTLADFIANIPLPEGAAAGPVNLALVVVLVVFLTVWTVYAITWRMR